MIRTAPGFSYNTPAGLKALDCFQSKELSLDKGAMSATGIFVSASRDRVGDIFNVAGIDLANHKRNPIVLWDHGWRLSMPIGKTEDPDGNYTVQLFPNEGKGIATTFFSQSLLEAEQIYALIDEGLLRAQSIGYRVLKQEPIQEDGRFAGFNIIQSEMLETSWVALPCNQDALRAALSSNICGKSLAPAVRRALSPYAGTRKVWAPGKAFDDPPANGEPEETPASSAAEDLQDVGQALHRAVYKAYKAIGEMCEKAMPALEETEHYPFAATHHDEAGNLMNRVLTSWEATWPDQGGIDDEADEQSDNFRDDYPEGRPPETDYVADDDDKLDEDDPEVKRLLGRLTIAMQKLIHEKRVAANSEYRDHYFDRMHPQRPQAEYASPFCS